LRLNARKGHGNKKAASDEWRERNENRRNLVNNNWIPPSVFVEVFILEMGLKVLCLHTLLEVVILKESRQSGAW